MSKELKSSAAMRVSIEEQSSVSHKRVMSSAGQDEAAADEPPKRAKTTGATGQRGSTTARAAPSWVDAARSAARPSLGREGIPQRQVPAAVELREAPPRSSLDAAAPRVELPSATGNITWELVHPTAHPQPPSTADTITWEVVQSTASAPAPLAKKSTKGTATTLKSVEEIEAEVQDILENQLLGKDVDVKIGALRTLTRYVAEPAAGSNGSSVVAARRRFERERYRQVLSDLNGCHLVLITLRKEMDNDDPNRDVAFGALRFLQLWHAVPARCDVSFRYKGIEGIVRVMKAFPNDAEIQRTAIASFFNFVLDDDAGRRQKLVDAGCVPLMVLAMTTFPVDQRMPWIAIRVLERLWQIGNDNFVERMIDDGVLTAVANAYSLHRDCACPECKVREAARRLMGHLTGGT